MASARRVYVVDSYKGVTIYRSADHNPRLQEVISNTDNLPASTVSRASKDRGRDADGASRVGVSSMQLT